MKKLTPKQEKFANLYVELGNASEAYRQAYDCSNTKDGVVWVKASELLSSGNVSVRVESLREELKKKHSITKEWILQQHLEIIDWYKELKELAKRKDLTKAEISRVYMLKDLIKGSDFRGSLDSLTKMFGLNEKSEIDINQTIEIIEKSRD